MVKHNQTIGRQITDELFECVWPFCKLALKRLKTHWNIYGLWRSKPSSIIKLSWSDFSDFLPALFAFAILTNKKHNMGVLDAFNMTCLISNYQEKQPNSNDDNSKIKKQTKLEQNKNKNLTRSTFFSARPSSLTIVNSYKNKWFTLFPCSALQTTEAVVRRCSTKKLFLKTLRNTGGSAAIEPYFQ